MLTEKEFRPGKLLHELKYEGLQLGDLDQHHGMPTDQLLMIYFRDYKWPKEQANNSKYYQEKRAREKRSKKTKIRTGFERRYVRLSRYRKNLRKKSGKSETPSKKDFPPLHSGNGAPDVCGPAEKDAQANSLEDLAPTFLNNPFQQFAPQVVNQAVVNQAEQQQQQEVEAIQLEIQKVIDDGFSCPGVDLLYDPPWEGLDPDLPSLLDLLPGGSSDGRSSDPDRNL